MPVVCCIVLALLSCHFNADRNKFATGEEYMKKRDRNRFGVVIGSEKGRALNWASLLFRCIVGTCVCACKCMNA